jgi:hypothetical protein
MLPDTTRTIPNLFEIRTLVLIAGVRVPHSSVSITSAFNTIPTCTVAVPPYHKLFGIGRWDRVPMQVFIKDVFGAETSTFEQYVLLFEGDITSFGYTNTAIGREFAVSAHGVLAFLKDVEVEFLTKLEDSFLSSITNRGYAKLTSTEFQPTFPLSLFSRGIGAVSTANMIHYPSDFLENVYNFVAQQPAVIEHLNDSALAEFYANYANNKIRLLNRYARLPFFDSSDGINWTSSDGRSVPFPILSYIQSHAGMSLLGQLMNNAPPSNSLYDIVTFVVSQMEYEFAFISAPILRNGNLVSSCLKPIFYDALPPACNIIYASHASSIRTEENVYQVPTRIKTESIDSMLDIIGSNDSVVPMVGKINFYPGVNGNSGYELANNNRKADRVHNIGLLPNEQFTGPYVYETIAPFWMMQIETNIQANSGVVTFSGMKDQILKTMLRLKQYEYRALSIETAFNPYVVPGFPGVVFDNADTDIAFAGQVLATTHMISKSSASTTVEMGFSRTLKEAAERPLENTFLDISTQITHRPDRMSRIYQELLGCNCVSYNDLHTTVRTDPRYSNPKFAYKANYRPIASIADYAMFLGAAAPDEEQYGTLGVLENNEFFPQAIVGTYFTGRYAEEFNSLHGESLVNILKEMANTEYDSLIYNY